MSASGRTPGISYTKQIVIETPSKEDISRQEYEKEIAATVRSFLSKNDPGGNRFLCLVLFYGIPLRVGPAHPGLLEERRILELRAQLSSLKERAAGKDPQGTKEVKDDIARIENEISKLSMARQGASVDSEIALVMENKYPLGGWLPNRYFAGFQGKNRDREEPHGSPPPTPPYIRITYTAVR
jgi:uncharacterized protein (TIGR03790 family)